MKSLITITAMAFFVVACSSGGGSGGNKAPADQVNSKITGNASKALTGQTAVFEVGQSLAKSRNKQITQMSAKHIEKGSVQSGVEAAAIREKSSQVNRAVQSSACKIAIDQSQNSSGRVGGAAAEFSPVKIKISGASCPLEITLEMSMEGMGGQSPCSESGLSMSCKFGANVKMAYQIRDEKLAEELEVRSGQIAMIFEIDQRMPNGQSDQMNMEFKGKGNFDLKAVDLLGQAHLISGKQDINIKTLMAASNQGEATLPQMLGGATEELQYFQQGTGVSSSFTATLIFNGSTPDEKYFVDGNPVTAVAYANERNKFSNSMMAFAAQSGNEQRGGNQVGQPEPAEPNRPSRPTPTPMPVPAPAPQPQPAPQPPSEKKWACVIQEYTKNDIFIGYGSVEFVAQSKAKQLCQASSASASCAYSPKCEEQEKNPQAWFCETKNYGNDQIYSGVGASKTEAGYHARKNCLAGSGSSASSCTAITDSNCAHQ